MIGQYKRGGVGYVLVKLDTVYKFKSGIKGLDGQDLVLGDEEFDRQRNAKTHGEVIQLPIALSKAPLYNIPPGFPAYGPIRFPDSDVDTIATAFYSVPNNKYKFQNDIAPEVEIGDQVFFPWTVTHDKRNLIAKAPDNKSFIFKLSYDLIYAVKRAGKVIPIGGHVLVDPLFETWDSILKPTYYPFKNPDGTWVERPKSEWIQIKTVPRTVDRTGVIKYIGTPLSGEKLRLKVGMKILYKPKLQSLQDIDGEKLFIIPQNQVLCYQE